MKLPDLLFSGRAGNPFLEGLNPAASFADGGTVTETAVTQVTNTVIVYVILRMNA
jgi:hypothetical protein